MPRAAITAENASGEREARVAALLADRGFELRFYPGEEGGYAIREGPNQCRT